MKPNAS